MCKIFIIIFIFKYWKIDFYHTHRDHSIKTNHVLLINHLHIFQYLGGFMQDYVHMVTIYLCIVILSALFNVKFRHISI